MAKAKTPEDEKLDKQDFDLFEALNAIDRKDYEYYDRLSEEQKQKFNPYMLVIFMSSVSGRMELQQYHLLSTNEFSNKYMFDERIQDHPKLQWMMLCASGLGKGKQFHNYIPSIKDNVAALKEKATIKDTKEYYKKIYKNASDQDITEIAKIYVELQNRKYTLAKKFPELKLVDIDALSQIVTDDDILKYEAECGN
jgi:hypothetical protein